MSGVICVVRPHAAVRSLWVSNKLVVPNMDGAKAKNNSSLRGRLWCGRRQDLRTEKKHGDVADLTPQALEKTFWQWGQRLSKKGRKMRASIG